MTAFIPPYPPRPKTTPSTREMYRLFRKNILHVFEERCFEHMTIALNVLTKRLFICNSPDTVQYAFVTNNASFERKSPQMRHALEPLLGDGLFVSDGETWRTRRDAVAPTIHTRLMPQFAPIMIETAVEMRDRWAALPPGGSIDMLAEMAQLTSEIICRTLFGRKLGQAHAQQVVEGFSEYQRVVGQTDILSLLGLPDWMPRFHGRAVRRSAARIHEVIDGIIAGHQDAPDGTSESVVGALMQGGSGGGLHGSALRNEAAVLFMAGHETTANLLSWTWYLLSQAPAVEAKLHAEIAAVTGGRAPTLADVPKLVYTRAILDEVNRLYPPVPLLSREAMVDETIRGRPVPKGTIVLVVPWLLHRHKRLWDKPDHFIPERFIPAPGRRKIPKYAYVPFSIGPRFCAGAAFGITEAVLCVAALAQTFRARLQPGHKVEPLCRLTLRPGDELPMTLDRHGPLPPVAAAPAGTSPATACPFGHGAAG